MTFTSLISVITVAIISKDVKCDKTSDIHFITDFVKQDESNLVVTAFLCWDKAEKHTFLYQMSQNNILTVLYETNEEEVKYYNSDHILYITDLDCNYSENVMLAANERRLFASPFKWLLLTNNEKIISDTEEYFLKYDILIDSRIILAHKIETNKYDLYEIYKYAKTSKNMQKIYKTSWNLSKGFNNVKPYISLLTRRNLNGTLLKSSIVVLNNDTLNHLTDSRFKHIDTITKVNYVFTNHLIDFVNGTREFSFVNTWGYLNKTINLYNGMIGALQLDEAEIGGTALFVTSDRVSIIEYLSMTTPTRAKFIFRQPPLSYVTNIFTLPFTRDVWLSSILLCFMSSLLLYIAVSVEWSQSGEEISNESSAMMPSFIDSALMMIGAVAQQGAVQEPRKAAGRTVMLCAFTALMFLYVSYSANIVALLQSSATNIRTLEDLLNSRLKLGVEDIVYNHYYFQTATEPTRKAIYEKKVAPKGQKNNFVKLDVGVTRLREGFYAFHGELGVLYKLVADTFFESEKCGLQEIEYLQVVEPYMAIKKNSTYKELIKTGLFLIRESGLQSREIQKLYTKKPECHSSGGNFVSVGLIDAYPAFLVLGSGMGLSLLLFLMEKFANKKKKSV